MKNNKKICVYAIAKNEIKFIDRWYDSIKEADYICVLDTGSTDGSFEKFKSLGIICEQKVYDNFRFDLARNDSMKLIPKDADICVCIDLDEFFKQGWSKILKSKWQKNTTRVRYRYTWNFNDDGSEGIVFMLDKIHKNNMYNWSHPVHEVLTNMSSENEVFLDLPEIELYHKADSTKSRSSYLPLLEISVKEAPNDDRNMHYLGREYMFNKEYDKAIETLEKHLRLPSAVWNLERSASLRYIAECYKQKGDLIKQEEYLKRAILEANTTREAYFQLGLMYFENERYLDCCLALEEMLKITNRELNYMSSPVCWSNIVYDYLSISYHMIGNDVKAIYYVDLCLKDSQDERLINNKNIFILSLNKKQS